MDDFSAAISALIPQTQFQLPTLYKQGAHDKVLVWMIAFDGESLVMQWGNTDQLAANTLQTARTRVEPNSNGESSFGLAVLQARARWKEYIDKGYSETIIDATVMNMTAMRGNEWDPNKKQIKRWPVWVQGKYDGVRCRASQDIDGSIVLLSRNVLKIHNVQHIREDLTRLMPFVKAELAEHQPFRLDGELYSMELLFDQINGMSRRGDRNPDPNEKYLLYYLFDIVLDNRTYDERYMILQKAFQNYSQAHPQSGLRLVECAVANTPQDILTAHRYYVSQGLEGVIIRKVGGTTENQRKESYYVGRKCSNFMKYKEFKDEEGMIVGASAATGNQEGAVVWRIKRPNGVEVDVVPKAQVEVRKQYYTVWQQFIGHKYRYRYQEETPDGSLRFPTGLGFVYDR